MDLDFISTCPVPYSEEDLSDESLIWKEISTLKERQNTLRKGLFQRYDNLMKELVIMKEKVANTESYQELI